MDLVNDTPFAAERLLFLDGKGLERLLVVVKATFTVKDRKTAVGEEQVPVTMADEYRGDPARSSLRVASDLAPFKPATDVLLQGSACAGATPRPEVLVAFQVGPMKKGIRVFGDRVWESTLGFHRVPTPTPFLEMEMTWERAFGGSEEVRPGQLDRCEENPVGVGYRGRGSRRPIAGSPLPNLEDPARLIGSPGGRPRPAGLGPIAPHWPQRARYAGTYGEAWRKTRFPLLPEDFDPRFHQVAPPDQIVPGHVRGGEPVVVAGMAPEGGMAFALPELRPRVLVKVGEGEEALGGACDTVVIDCERSSLTVVWRASLEVQGRVERIRWIEIAQGEGRGG